MVVGAWGVGLAEGVFAQGAADAPASRLVGVRVWERRRFVVLNSA